MKLIQLFDMMNNNNSTSITEFKIIKSITMYQQRINCLIDHQFPNYLEIKPEFSTKKNYHNTQMTLTTPTKTNKDKEKLPQHT
jgi:hypothetical protein